MLMYQAESQYKSRQESRGAECVETRTGAVKAYTEKAWWLSIEDRESDSTNEGVIDKV